MQEARKISTTKLDEFSDFLAVHFIGGVCVLCDERVEIMKNFGNNFKIEKHFGFWNSSKRYLVQPKLEFLNFYGLWVLQFFLSILAACRHFITNESRIYC